MMDDREVQQQRQEAHSRDDDPLLDPDFQVLEQREALEAVDAHVREYVARHPVTAKMSPDQLREALEDTLRRLDEDAERAADLPSVKLKRAACAALSVGCAKGASGLGALALKLARLYSSSWVTRAAVGGGYALAWRCSTRRAS